MPTLTEGKHTAQYILSEANGSRSREVVTISSGSGKLQAGTVLGRITATGEYAPSPVTSTAGIEGAEVATAILYAGVDATTTDVKATVTARATEVKAEELLFHSSVDQPAERAAKFGQLAAPGIGIIVR